MAQISIRVKDDVKKNAELVCAEIGMSVSTAINIFLKRLGNEGRIPCEIGINDPFYKKAIAVKSSNSVGNSPISTFNVDSN